MYVTITVSRANWYRQNEFTAPYVMGYDLDCEYFWRNEVNYTLRCLLCKTKHPGDDHAFRWAADITMRDLNFVRSEHVVDRKFTIGSIGISKPENKTLNYLYYGYPLRKEISTVRDGLPLITYTPERMARCRGLEDITSITIRAANP